MAFKFARSKADFHAAPIRPPGFRAAGEYWVNSSHESRQKPPGSLYTCFHAGRSYGWA